MGNYLINGGLISNINHPWLFFLVNQGVKLILIILFIHFIIRAYLVFYKKKSYSFNLLLKDFFLIFCYFLIFWASFQNHYLCWLVPFFIIFILLDCGGFYYIFIAYTVIGFIHSFRSEFGVRTFFLDIIEAFNPAALSSRAVDIFYKEGSIIVFLLLLTILILLILKEFRITSKLEEKSIDKINCLFYFLFIFIVWVLIFIPYTQAISVYSHQSSHPTELAYGDGLYHRGVVFGIYLPYNITDNKLAFDNHEKQAHLILENLQRLSEQERANFDAFIIIKNKDKERFIKDTLIIGDFNGCLINNWQPKITSLYYREEFNGFKVGIECVAYKDNAISLKSTQGITNDDIHLYIINKKADYTYLESKKNFITVLAIIGCFYIIAIFYFSLLIIKRLK